MRIVQELGKSRASAVAIRGYTVDDIVQQDESMINPAVDTKNGDDEAVDAESGNVLDQNRESGITNVSLVLKWTSLIDSSTW